MVRKDQVRQSARFVDEVPEADDKGDFLQRVLHPPSGRRREDGVAAVDEEQLNGRTFGSQDLCAQLVEGTCGLLSITGPSRSGRAGRQLDLRHERDSAWLPDTPQQLVEGVHGQRVKQTVGVGKGRAANQHDGGLLGRELTREPLDARGRNARPLFNLGRRVVGQPRGPAIDERTRTSGLRGRAELCRDDDMREAEREHALGARLHRHPFVGIGAGLRHPLFDLHKLRTDTGSSLPHRAVRGVLCHGRIPGSQEVGAERESVSRTRQVDGRKLVVTEAQTVRATKHVFAKGLELNRWTGAEPVEELSDELVSNPSVRPRQEPQRLPVACRGKCVEMGKELGESLVPRDRLQLAAAPRANSLERSGQPVRMIGDLYPCLAAHA